MRLCQNSPHADSPYETHALSIDSGEDAVHGFRDPHPPPPTDSPPPHPPPPPNRGSWSTVAYLLFSDSPYSLNCLHLHHRSSRSPSDSSGVGASGLQFAPIAFVLQDPVHPPSSSRSTSSDRELAHRDCRIFFQKVHLSSWNGSQAIVLWNTRVFSFLFWNG